MARQKKIVPYVLSAKLPTNSGDFWYLLWENNKLYSFDQMIDMAWTTVENREEGHGHYKSWYTREDMRAAYAEKFTTHALDPQRWNEYVDPGRNGKMWPSHYFINEMLRLAWWASPERKALDAAFFAEYDAREDLQQLYSENYVSCYWHTDEWGNNFTREGSYGKPQLWDAYRNRPSCYAEYLNIANTHNARTFIEKARVPTFQPGDLVRLRDPYVGHDDYDPLYVTRWEVVNEGKVMPGREVPRIGTVMELTNSIPWRASKGSKRIEIMWIGQEGTVLVPEKVLKWEERPTKKNGLK